MADELKRAAWEDESWETVGPLSDEPGAAVYRLKRFDREFLGRIYRFLAVHSSALEAKKEQTLEKKRSLGRETWEKDAAAEAKRTYRCAADVEEALRKWCAKHRGFHRIEAETLREEIPGKRNQRGRPRQGEPPPPPITVYRNRIRILPQEEAEWERIVKREATFILITNIRDEERLPNEGVIATYKEQHQVERRFRFLKSPYFVGPIFLKNKNRVEAFGYVMLMAVLVYSVIERLLREAMKRETEPLILPGMRKSFSPTAMAVLELLESVIVMKLKTAAGVVRILPENTEPQLERILSLLGLHQKIYTQNE